MRLTEVIAAGMSQQTSITIKLLSDLHIGAGAGGQGWVDRAVIRDVDGYPVIPGSHLKGVVRDNAERIRDITSGSPCRAPRADAMCPRAGVKEDCIVCKLFGNPRSPAALVFSDLTIAEELRNMRLDPQVMTMVRNQVTIDRNRLTSKDARLFSTETVPSGTLFRGTLRVLRPLDREERILLERALKLADKLGANKSVGLGNVRLTFEEIGK